MGDAQGVGRIRPGDLAHVILHVVRADSPYFALRVHVLEQVLPPQLLALQLRAHGYSDEQIGRLVEQSPRGVAVLLELAAQRLGTRDLATAIAVARRRGLIV